MKKLLAFLDEKGLKSENLIITSIRDSNIDDLVQFVNDMRNIIMNDTEEDISYSPFSYVASPDISGFTGCPETKCRLDRIEEFSYFASLYADRVYINLQSINNTHFTEKLDEKNNYFWFRYTLTNDILSIYKIYPLLYQGIVQINKPKYYICKDCMEKRLKDIDININVSELEDNYIDKVDVRVSTWELPILNEKYRYEISGFTDIYEHKTIVQLSSHIPESVESKLCQNKKYKLSKNEIKQSGIIKYIIEKEINNLRINTIQAKVLDSKCLTFRHFDSYIWELAKDGKKDNVIDIQENVPIYDLPIIHGTNIETILRIREIENDAFIQYRVALNKAAKERTKLTNVSGLKQIYEDIIYPAFADLDKKVNRIRNGTYKKVLGEFVIIGSSVAIGMSTGLIPHDPSSILPALGGMTLLTKTGSSILDWNRKQDDVKDNDFYFLWKLKK